MNNIAQRIERDILTEKMLYLDSVGASIALHTYDDIVQEVPLKEAEAKRVEMERAMREVPAWAKGLPLFAKPKIMARYGK